MKCFLTGIKDKDTRVIMVDTDIIKDIKLLLKKMDKKYPDRVWLYGYATMIIKK